MGGISIWQLLIVVVIVVLLFGTKKLSSLGSDLGASIKGFKKAMSDDEKSDKVLSQMQILQRKLSLINKMMRKKTRQNATTKSRCNSCSISVLVNYCWCS